MAKFFSSSFSSFRLVVRVFALHSFVSVLDVSVCLLLFCIFLSLFASLRSLCMSVSGSMESQVVGVGLYVKNHADTWRFFFVCAAAVVDITVIVSECCLLVGVRLNGDTHCLCVWMFWQAKGIGKINFVDWMHYNIIQSKHTDTHKSGAYQTSNREFFNCSSLDMPNWLISMVAGYKLMYLY